MKTILPGMLLVLFLLMQLTGLSQQPEDGILKSYEYREKDAILKGDTAELRKLLSPRVLVQNPDNRIVSYAQIVDRIRSGKIDYTAFERNIESMTFNGNNAIVMGNEVVRPTGNAINAGKKVTQRFTNVWVKEGNQWRMIARQATVVLVE